MSASISVNISSDNLSKLAGTSKVIKSIGMYSFKNTAIKGDATSLIPYTYL